jgi:hypothetical protein
MLAVEALRCVMEDAGPGMDKESTDICRRMAALLVEAAAIFGAKQRAYGPGNVQEIGGEGVLRRVREKVRRVEHLRATGGGGGDEAIRDSLLDSANLSLIACMVQDGAWPAATWAVSDDA